MKNNRNDALYPPSKDYADVKHCESSAGVSPPCYINRFLFAAGVMNLGLQFRGKFKFK